MATGPHAANKQGCGLAQPYENDLLADAVAKVPEHARKDQVVSETVYEDP